MVAGTQNVLFLCNCCSTTIVPSFSDQSCCRDITGRAKKAEWRQKPWWLKCCGGRWMEAQWSPQWSLNGRHWSAKGGTMVVQGRQTGRSNWYTMFVFFTGRPMADLCASILRPRRCVYLHPAPFGRPVSDRPPRRPLCDCFEHAQNFTATMASMAMSERPMCHPWTTKATVRPPFCLQRRPGQFCGRTREAQRSQPLCKGGISSCRIPILKIGRSHDRLIYIMETHIRYWGDGILILEWPHSWYWWPIFSYGCQPW